MQKSHLSCGESEILIYRETIVMRSGSPSYRTVKYMCYTHILSRYVFNVRDAICQNSIYLFKHTSCAKIFIFLLQIVTCFFIPIRHDNIEKIVLFNVPHIYLNIYLHKHKTYAHTHTNCTHKL